MKHVFSSNCQHEQARAVGVTVSDQSARHDFGDLVELEMELMLRSLPRR